MTAAGGWPQAGSPTADSRVDRNNVDAGAYTTIAHGQRDGTYLDNTAAAGQAYFYRVYAQNAAGQSALSAAAAVVNPHGQRPDGARGRPAAAG